MTDKEKELFAQALNLITELDKDGLVLEMGLILEMREALAQPEQEPVAWIGNADFVKGQFVEGRVRRVWWECNTGVGQPLYTAPFKPAQSDNQEPVAKHICNLWINPETSSYEVDRCTHPINEVIPVYTAPPRKEWVGLTEDDMHTIRGDAFNKNVDDMNWAVAMARKIDFILRKRNT